jgi:16S rRNA (adenine1518-N6/adenine1519-N6)-dimethyltransferase
MLPIRQRKSLGQHFINDPNIISNISSIIINKIQEKLNNTFITILEIGSSYGILSFNLLDQLISNDIPFNLFILNEIDYRLIKKLELKIEENNKFNELFLDKKLQIMNIPFEKIDLSQFKELVLVGNIPFYITGIVLRKIIDYNQNLKLIVLNLQKEVVDKIKSLNSAQSIVLNTIYDIDYHFIIHPKYYTPKPKVFSQIISFNKKQEFSRDYINKLYKFLDKIYKNKNKKLLNILNYKELNKIKNLANDDKINLILKKRANNLDFKELLILFDYLI